MVANYFTLLHLTKSLRARLGGLTLRDLFSQQRSTLILHAAQEGHDEWVEISCDGTANYILPRRTFARARKNSIDVFPELIGRSIVDVSLHGGDRQLTILLESDERLLVQLYGTSANVHWLSPSRVVRASFLKPTSLAGKASLESVQKPFQVPESFGDLGLHEDSGPLRNLLRSALPQLGPIYIREALHRSGFSGDESLTDLSTTRQTALVEALCSVVDELLRHPTARLYERGDEGPVLSLCILSYLGDAPVRAFPTLEEAIALRLSQGQRSKGLRQEKGQLLAQIERMIHRTEQTLAKAADEAARGSRSEQYERFGSLLMAHLGELTKGMGHAEFEDIFDQGQTRVRIPLERALSPIQNAERYFAKAKKARTAASEASLRTTSLQKDLQQAQALRQAFEAAESREDLEACLSDHRSVLKKFGISSARSSREAAQERVPFRVFTVTGGFAVWAGKSSENNDLLTLKYARPNDLWFHARGSGGSHVVLRHGTGKGEISKRAIEEAASIAAYYSKMKNASTVPVAMTQRKYVRKTRGAPAGTVTIEREKVLFVEPRLPRQPEESQDE